ncbi:MAG: RNA 2',3'-cyclic phosphodiesterase [Saccharofermentanales bacterium]|jgi:2'-5' RNA ligase
MDERRLFIAIALPTDVQAALSQVVQDLRLRVSGGRWVAPGNHHITLQFLGETPKGKVTELANLIQEATKETPRFVLHLEGIGLFGRRQGVLWMGVRQNKILTDLVDKLRFRLAMSGFVTEKRPYVPHITLARQISLAPELAESWRCLPIKCPVHEIVLMESRIEHSRRVYLPLYSQTLTALPSSGS